MGKLNKQTGLFDYQYKLVDKNNNYIQRVYDFAEDKNKRLWIATMGFGLFYYDLKTKEFTSVQSQTSLINEWIGCLHYSDDNKLYVGTYDGVNCIDLDSPDFQSHKILSQNVIYSIFEDADGVVWLGSSEGLSGWNKKTKELTTYTTADGLPSNTIYAIQGDGKDFLWISTNAGISQFQKKNNKFINYYVSDGLQGNEFYKNASFKDKQGIIWFGGMNGITYFNPQDIINPAKTWNIRITDFFLHNNPVRKGMKSGIHNIINCPVFNAKEFYLSYKDNVFSIEFATLELNAPEHINYLYSINDEKWISLPKGVNRISFSNLKPGTYNFKIRAKDNTVYSNIKEITIFISPAWYASWWAKVIYSLLLLTIIFIIILQIRHRYRMHQEMLQHIHAEQINEAKLQFFINISHEIRTPMSLIISPLQKLIKNEENNERLKIYHIIYRNAERILNLVNQLMDIRKIDKGQMFLMFRETNIIPFIEDLCTTFGQQANTKNIRLQLHSTLPELNVWVDTGNFDKIILNILSNAFKFTPEKGNIDITIRTGEDNTLPDPLKQYAEIIIADTGTGIDEQEKERIFDRFYQIRNSQQNPKGGTGIGLHLTRSLVELHHGIIYVENNKEQPGCRFIIRLPLGNKHLRPEEVDNNEQKVTVAAPTVPVISPIIENEEEKKVRVKTKYHVLIVEDDEEIRNYIAQEFGDKFHIMESRNGKEALEQILKKAPDLVISDIMMPEMDGVETLHGIKALSECPCKDTPVVVLTANAVSGAKEAYLSEGFDDFLSKPVVPDKLEAMLLKMLPQEMLCSIKEKEPAPKAEFSLEELPMVEGLDWNYACLHLPGQELLAYTVREFYDQIDAAADCLERAYVQCTKENNLEPYRIQVHAMKSLAATVGIISLSGIARVLESAAKDGKINVILSMTAVFLEEWRSYRQRLQGVFGIGTRQGKEITDYSVIQALVEMVRVSMQELDIDSADEWMKQLRAYDFPDKIGQNVLKLAEAVTNLDTEESERLANLLSEQIAGQQAE